ncbi:MAG: hypothetical protein IPL61_07190 [Myxococcales bacterium]|nr:hypothetical protein [Myxococcales bacterium]
MALEHVAHGQTRMVTPGVAPDTRGVVLGRFCLLVFPSLEGVVSWLRVYSHEASVDELVAGLEILRVRTPLMSREMILKIPAVSSYAADRAARMARLVGGAIYTGTSKHFVKYRDDRAPYGYDAVDIGALAAGVEFMVHDDDFTQAYVREGALPLDRLLFRLSLRRAPGSIRLSPEQRSDLYLAVARGLGDGVIRYLWRNKVDATVGLVTPRAPTAGLERGADPSYLLLRVRELPERILGLCVGTPGIDVFAPAGANVAVAVGWNHPVELSACATILPEDSFHLFWPGDRVDVVPGPLELSRLADLTRIDLGVEDAAPPVAYGLRSPEVIGVDLRLAPAVGGARRVTATLIPTTQAGHFKRLVFALPPASLRGLRAVVTDRGILVVAPTGIDVVPLGTLLTAQAPGILVPLGLEIVPRVSPDVLAAALDHGSGQWTVFTGDGAPFQIADSALGPLERRAIAKLETDRVEVRDVAVAAAGDPTVVNDPLGRFALWGFPDTEQKQLTSG